MKGGGEGWGGGRRVYRLLLKSIFSELPPLLERVLTPYMANIINNTL
jgi:hypothetical protein